MARDDPQVNIRMAADLKDRLDAAASENNRSLTGEINSRLAWSFVAHPHSYILRAALDLHDKLLAGKEEIEIPPMMQDELRARANKMGISPQKFLIRILLAAINEIDEKTELGEEFARHLYDLEGNNSGNRD